MAAPAASFEEETLDIPLEGFKHRTAFSMDIGGSMAKIIYATDEGTCVRLHFASFPRHETEAGIHLLRDKMADQLAECSVINTCGVGFQSYTDLLTTTLNVRVQTNSESDCFIEALNYMLKNMPLEEIVHPDPEQTKQVSPVVADMIAKAVNVLSGSGRPWHLADDSGGAEVGIQYPVMLCMLGSAGAVFKVEADGSFMVAEIFTRCGRMMLGLAKLLVGAESFDELMVLAAAGDADKVHVLAKHLQTDTEDVYSSVPEQFMVYCFGQAMNKTKDSFERGDIAAALVSMMSHDLAQCCHMAAMIHNAKTLFFCGNLVGASHMIRNDLSEALAIRCLLNSLNTRYRCHFLRFGGYYGALGALLRTLKGI